MSFTKEIMLYRFVFQGGDLVFSDFKARDLFNINIRDSEDYTWDDFLENFWPEDRKLIEMKADEVCDGIPLDSVLSANITNTVGVRVPINLLIDKIDYYSGEALQVVLLSIIQHQEDDEQLQQESEVMRDVLAALAGTDDLQQALEVILLNLHDVIKYDRAGLVLADEDKRFVLAPKETAGSGETRILFLDNDPVIKDVLFNQSVLIIPDVQADRRFDEWPDMESVRGWLAAPLIVDGDIIGILTLASLSIDAFHQNDARFMKIFADQVAQILEKAWVNEQKNRRAKDLEVISSISLALGQAESSENTLHEIVDRVKNLFGALQGVLLLPDITGTNLRIEDSQDNFLLGKMISNDEKFFWKALKDGKITGINDFENFIFSHPEELFRILLKGARSAIVIPLLSDEKVFGLLCYTLEDQEWFSDDRIRLANTVSEIAGASIHRAVLLKALERQVDLRTQHLSTLYEINAIASQPLELNIILDRILEITLHSINCQIGFIHFFDEKADYLDLFESKNLSDDLHQALEKISLSEGFWNRLINSSNPLVIPNINNADGVPDVLKLFSVEGVQAYIGVPIRTKGKLLGLLSILSERISEYTIEDFTLFMTIADQIGGSVERASLMEQAEIAAVVEERQRVARELHDSVTQLLYGQVLFTGASLKQLKQGNQEVTIQHLERIDKAALQALKEMRLLIYQLQPSDYLKEGIIKALEKRLDSVEKRTGIDARIIVDHPIKIDSSQEIMLYRIAEEALNNTLKHANASAVSIRIGTKMDKLFMEIKDNGTGFNLEEKIQGGGMGLKNMQKRASELGGVLEISSRPGEGTTLMFEIEEFNE
jgi:signal transduction histidine kinase